MTKIVMAESNCMDLPLALDLASRRMGVDGLKPKQLEAIESFVSGKDTFVSLSTGYGKSLIFAILPLLFDFLFGKAGLNVITLCAYIFAKTNPREHCCSCNTFNFTNDQSKGEIFTARFKNRICW